MCMCACACVRAIMRACAREHVVQTNIITKTSVNSYCLSDTKLQQNKTPPAISYLFVMVQGVANLH